VRLLAVPVIDPCPEPGGIYQYAATNPTNDTRFDKAIAWNRALSRLSSFGIKYQRPPPTLGGIWVGPCGDRHPPWEFHGRSTTVMLLAVHALSPAIPGDVAEYAHSLRINRRKAKTNGDKKSGVLVGFTESVALSTESYLAKRVRVEGFQGCTKRIIGAPEGPI